MEGIGNYGGTIRRGFKGISDRNGPSEMTAEGLTSYTRDLNVRLNMIASREINSDASRWTLNRRKNIKWSDGYPLDDTIEDEHLLSTQSCYWEEPGQHA